MDYSFAQIPVEGAEAALWMAVGALGLLGWGYAAWRFRKDMPWVAFGLVVFLGAYLPVSNLLIPMGTIMAERVLYIPSAGFLIALVPTAGVWLSRRDWRIGAALLVGVCLLFGVLTLKRNHEWGDTLRFWRRTAEVSPKSARGAQGVWTGPDRPEQVPRSCCAAQEIRRDISRLRFRLGGFRNSADAKR